MRQQVVIAVAYSVESADNVVGFLDSNGIPAWADGVNMAYNYMALFNSMRGFKIWVPRSAASQAHSLLMTTPMMRDSVELIGPTVSKIPTACPQCESTKIQSGKLPWYIVLILMLMLVGIPFLATLSKGWSCAECGHQWEPDKPKDATQR